MQIGAVFRNAAESDLFLDGDNFSDLGDEPRIIFTRGVNDLGRRSKAKRLGYIQNTLGCRPAEGGANCVPAIAIAQSRNGNFVEAGEAGFQSAQSLLQGFGEGA